MKRARTVEEYVGLIKDAIYEIEDMRAAIEFDEEGMGASNKVIDELEEYLKEIYDLMMSGDYCWRTGDLKYMELIRNVDDGVVPFRSLLVRINDTHKNGLEPAEEE